MEHVGGAVSVLPLSLSSTFPTLLWTEKQAEASTSIQSQAAPTDNSKGNMGWRCTGI